MSWTLDPTTTWVGEDVRIGTMWLGKPCLLWLTMVPEGLSTCRSRMKGLQAQSQVTSRLRWLSLFLKCHWLSNSVSPEIPPLRSSHYCKSRSNLTRPTLPCYIFEFQVIIPYPHSLKLGWVHPGGRAWYQSRPGLFNQSQLATLNIKKWEVSYLFCSVCGFCQHLRIKHLAVDSILQSTWLVMDNSS